MQIKVFFFARLKEIFGQSYRIVTVKEGARIDEVVWLLSQESKELSKSEIPLIYAVNENFEEGDKILKTCDELAIMTPMSGG